MARKTSVRWLTLVALALLTIAMARHHPSSVASAAIPVHWSEGTLHGFLDLHTAAGDLLAHGDLLQVPRDSDIESRLVFHFADGSEFLETVTFTQHGVFSFQSYHLVQRGKAFAADLEVTLSHTGEYEVTTTSHKDGEKKRDTGKLNLPPDVYNGMIPIIGKNIPTRGSQTVHVVAFTPKPIILPLEFVSSGTQPFDRFTLKPKLNLLQRIGAALKRQTPPDSHLWIMVQDVPAFVRFEGPMYSGPVWRVDVVSPRLPEDRPRT